MIQFDSDIKIWIYHKPVDMRKSIDGLSILVSEALSCNPQSRAVFLFYNRQGDKFKALLWDKDGFILLYKRRETGRFCFPKHQRQHYCIDADLFVWLRRGFDFSAINCDEEVKKTVYY